MRTITDHEFLRHKNGDLALLIDMISFEEALDPVLLVSKDEPKIYLRRSVGDVHEITGIHPEIIEDVRKTDNIVILELIGKDVKHSYNVPTGILEDEE